MADRDAQGYHGGYVFIERKLKKGAILETTGIAPFLCREWVQSNAPVET